MNSTNRNPLDDRGLLSRAHNPLLVIVFMLGAIVALGMMALSMLYDIDLSTPVDNQRRMFEANRTVAAIAVGGGVVAAIMALIRKPPQPLCHGVL